MFWEKEIETMDRRDLEALQLQRLRETLERAKRSVYYERRFAERGINRRASAPWPT
jgi:phenylacetate-CoA ligase